MPQKGLKFQYEECLYPELGHCHVCVSHSGAHGYPRFMREGKSQFVSRYVYEKYIGKIPKGLCVLHLCDNPGCINPAHLYAGTKQDNVNDMFERGRDRSPKGEKNGQAKLKEQQVKEIRSNKKDSQAVLGRKYGVHRNTIFDIKHNRTWNYVEN